MKLFAQIMVIALSFLGIFLLRQGGINLVGTLILIALLTTIYSVVLLLRKKGSTSKIAASSGVDIFIINTVVVFTIIITGALSSPLFFLIYFLSFGISLIFYPATAFIYAVGAALIFVPELMTNFAPDSWIKLGSLIMIAPLSYFFGRAYKSTKSTNTEAAQRKKKEVTIDEAIASLTRPQTKEKEKEKEKETKKKKNNEAATE